jgi:hypothetical protein
VIKLGGDRNCPILMKEKYISRKLFMVIYGHGLRAQVQPVVDFVWIVDRLLEVEYTKKEQ